MRIPVRVRVFPGSDQERLDLAVAVKRHCACQSAPGADPSVSVVGEMCPPHDLVLHESSLKRLVFYRRWHRARRAAGERAASRGG